MVQIFTQPVRSAMVRTSATLVKLGVIAGVLIFSNKLFKTAALSALQGVNTDYQTIRDLFKEPSKRVKVKELHGSFFVIPEGGGIVFEDSKVHAVIGRTLNIAGWFSGVWIPLVLIGGAFGAGFHFGVHPATSCDGGGTRGYR